MSDILRRRDEAIDDLRAQLQAASSDGQTEWKRRLEKEQRILELEAANKALEAERDKAQDESWENWNSFKKASKSITSLESRLAAVRDYAQAMQICQAMCAPSQLLALTAPEAQPEQKQPDDDDYVAWMRFAHRKDNQQPCLQICDSDAEGAFRVRRVIEAEVVCTRTPGHVGPCNGFPRSTCAQPAAQEEK